MIEVLAKVQLQFWLRCGEGTGLGAAQQSSAQTPGHLIITTPCFQLDPQALPDRDWQRTVIAMNGVCTHGALLVLPPGS